MPTRNVPSDWADIAAAFGTRVRELRELRRMTQEELAHASGLSRNQVQNIENSRNNNRDEKGRRVGGTANPRLETIWALAQALDVDVTELVRR